MLYERGPRVETWTSAKSPWVWRAFDILFLLSLIVPVECMMVVWSVTGTSGDMQKEYLLPENAPTLMKIFVIIACAFIPVLFAKHDRSVIWRLFFPSLIVMANTFTGVTERAAFLLPFSVSYAAALIAGIYTVGGGCIRFTGLSWIVGWIVIGVSSNEILSVIAKHQNDSDMSLAFSSIIVGGGVGLATGAVVAGVALLQQFVGGRKIEWLFYALIMTGLISAYLALAIFLPIWKESYYFSGPQIYLCGYLATTKILFDVCSLFVTKWLIRNGIERGGFAPLICVIIDIMLSALINVAAIIVVIEMTKIFNGLSGKYGGMPVIDVRKTIEGILANPLSSEWYWIYALFLFNVIPCLVNILICSTSTVRCIPFINEYIFNRAKTLRTNIDEVVVAIIISGTWVLGAMLASTGIVGFAWCTIKLVMPDLGQWILSFA